MRSIIVVLCLFELVLSREIKLTPKLNTKELINVKMNDEIVIDLTTNPSTGYSWKIDYDSKIVALSKDEVLPQNYPTTMVGVPVVRQIKFHPNSLGSCLVTFSYQRPWEKKEPVHKIQYTFNIK